MCSHKCKAKKGMTLLLTLWKRLSGNTRCEKLCDKEFLFDLASPSAALASSAVKIVPVLQREEQQRGWTDGIHEWSPDQQKHTHISPFNP